MEGWPHSVRIHHPEARHKWVLQSSAGEVECMNNALKLGALRPCMWEAEGNERSTFGGYTTRKDPKAQAKMAREYVIGRAGRTREAPPTNMKPNLPGPGPIETSCIAGQTYLESGVRLDCEHVA